jgi:hypothetical protein
MTEHKTIYAALAAAQAEMGRAAKDAKNPHLKSKYADLASVMDACMPALSKHGIAVFQPTYDDETCRYVKTIFAHGDTGDCIECRVPLILQKNDMQGYGSAVTYARRYGLMCMSGIAPEDDDGHAAAKAAPKPEPKPAAPSAEAIAAAANSLGNADSIDQLKAIWMGLPKPIQAQGAVIDAKDGRKAALEAPQEEPQ